MEISNLSDAEFKTEVMMMLKELSEDCKNIKKVQSETKDSLIKIKTNLQRNNNRMDEAEKQINDLDIRKQKRTDQNIEKKIPKNESKIISLRDNFKMSDIHIIGVSKEEKEQEIGNLFEKIMTGNVPNFAKELDMQDQEAQSPNQVGPKEDHTKTYEN